MGQKLQRKKLKGEEEKLKEIIRERRNQRESNTRPAGHFLKRTKEIIFRFKLK